MKFLTQLGLGLNKRQAAVISLEQEGYLWTNGYLGKLNPGVLLNTMVYMLGLNFALRAGQEHRRLRIGLFSQLSLHFDQYGKEYLQYEEDLSKSYKGGLHHKKCGAKSNTCVCKYQW